jgi:hypothetical protein
MLPNIIIMRVRSPTSSFGYNYFYCNNILRANNAILKQSAYGHNT